MKIIFFIESLKAGGKERRMLELINYLKKISKYEIIIVLLKPDIQYNYVFEWNIPIIILERKWIKRDPTIFYKFYKICKKFNPDIIHTWSIINTFYAISSKLILNIPIVSSMITNTKPNFNKHGLVHLFFKASNIFSDAITSNSIAGLNAYQICTNKSYVIYNGINLERFCRQFNFTEVRTKYLIKTPYLITMVASMNASKNYDLFIDLAKKVLTTRSDITFLGVGDGPLFSKIYDRVINEKITNVQLIGHSNDIESIVAISDIGVLFTNSEGFPNSVLEYMALKKPVIVSNVGGIKELVSSNKTGYLVNNSEFSKIYNITLFLINNPRIRNQYGENGYQAILNNYTIDKMSQKFENIYTSVTK